MPSLPVAAPSTDRTRASRSSRPWARAVAAASTAATSAAGSTRAALRSPPVRSTPPLLPLSGSAALLADAVQCFSGLHALMAFIWRRRSFEKKGVSTCVCACVL